MNPIKYILLVVLTLVAIGASVFAWRQQQELVSLRAAAMNPAERATLQKRAWDAEKRARQFETQLAAIRSQAADPATLALTPTDAAAGASPQNRVLGDVVNGWLAVMNDPEAQRLMAQQQRAQISSRYAELFRSLALPPDRLAGFKNLLLEKQTVRNDVLLAATQQGINPLTNPQEFKQLEGALQAEIDQKIKATLGDAAFEQFQNYQQTQGQRSVVKQLEESLSFTSTPLSPAQSAQMVQILGQTPPPRNASARNNSTVTDGTIAVAQGVLSPPQLQALKELQDQQQAGTELNRLIRERQGSLLGIPGARSNDGTTPVGRGRPGR